MWRLYFDKVRMSRIPMRDNTGSNPVEIILLRESFAGQDGGQVAWQAMLRIQLCMASRQRTELQNRGSYF